MDEGVAYSAGYNIDQLSDCIADRISNLAETYGTYRIAVFVVTYDNMDKSIPVYEEPRLVCWFGLDYEYGEPQFTTGNVAKFASAVGYTVLQVHDSGHPTVYTCPCRRQLASTPITICWQPTGLPGFWGLP